MSDRDPALAQLAGEVADRCRQAGVVEAAGVDLDHRGAQAPDALARRVGARPPAPAPWPGRCRRARARPPPASENASPARFCTGPSCRSAATRRRSTDDDSRAASSSASRSRRPSRRRRARGPGQRQLDQPQQQQRADHDRARPRPGCARRWRRWRSGAGRSRRGPAPPPGVRIGRYTSSSEPLVALVDVLRLGEVAQLGVGAPRLEGLALVGAERVAAADQPGLVGVDDAAVGRPDLDPHDVLAEHALLHDAVERARGRAGVARERGVGEARAPPPRGRRGSRGGGRRRPPRPRRGCAARGRRRRRGP